MVAAALFMRLESVTPIGAAATDDYELRAVPRRGPDGSPRRWTHGQQAALLTTTFALELRLYVFLTDRGNRCRGRPPLIALMFQPHDVGSGPQILQQNRGVADRLLIDKSGGARRVGFDEERADELRRCCPLPEGLLPYGGGRDSSCCHRSF